MGSFSRAARQPHGTIITAKSLYRAVRVVYQRANCAVFKPASLSRQALVEIKITLKTNQLLVHSQFAIGF
jgi:hypothetical protein